MSKKEYWAVVVEFADEHDGIQLTGKFDRDRAIGICKFVVDAVNGRPPCAVTNIFPADTLPYYTSRVVSSVQIKESDT